VETQRKGLTFWLLTAFFALFVLFLYGPMIAVFILSFQGPGGGMTFPMRGVSLHWFADLFSSTRYGDLGDAFWRSIALSLLVMLITVVVSFFAGLGFRRRFWGSGALFYLAIVSLVMPGILTGTIIGLARALGETAPLLLIGMVAFVADYPTTPLDPATALPVQIYMWSNEAERAFVERMSGAIMILLGFLMVMNLAAIVLRRKFERRW